MCGDFLLQFCLMILCKENEWEIIDAISGICIYISVQFLIEFVIKYPFITLIAYKRTKNDVTKFTLDLDIAGACENAPQKIREILTLGIDLGTGDPKVIKANQILILDYFIRDFYLVLYKKAKSLYSEFYCNSICNKSNIELNLLKIPSTL